MQNHHLKLGYFCLSAIALLSTTLLPANAADSSDTRTRYTKTSRSSSITRKAPSRKPIRSTRNSGSSAISTAIKSDLKQEDLSAADSDLSSTNISNASLRTYLRHLNARVRRNERIANSKIRMLQRKVARLERDLAPVRAQQRRNRQRKMQGQRNQAKVRKTVRDAGQAVGNTANQAKNGVVQAGRKTQKGVNQAANNVKKGISNGVNQAQDTFNNMMPGGN